jgi:hypothetical protein
MRASRLPAFLARAALLLGASLLAGCGAAPSPVPSTQLLSGAIQDAPPVDAPGDTYAFRFRTGGTFNATLAWEEPPPGQPLGRAWLRLRLTDGRGQVALDTIDTPLRNPITLSTTVFAGDYALSITAQPRDRVAFYCLCRVPYTVTVRYP